MSGEEMKAAEIEGKAKGTLKSSEVLSGNYLSLQPEQATHTKQDLRFRMNYRRLAVIHVEVH
jgi:hypothetical protein